MQGHLLLWSAPHMQASFLLELPDSHQDGDVGEKKNGKKQRKRHKRKKNYKRRTMANVSVMRKKTNAKKKKNSEREKTNEKIHLHGGLRLPDDEGGVMSRGCSWFRACPFELLCLSV